MTCPTQYPAWSALSVQAANPPSLHTPKSFSSSACSLRLDYSLQRVDSQILSLLHDLAQQADVVGQARAMAQGEPINSTEGRAVLHMALRGDEAHQHPWGETLTAAVAHQRERFLRFADAVRSGEVLSPSGLAFNHVVNIGIGGSDLGPRMACEALGPGAESTLPVTFVSNPDPWCIAQALAPLDPSRTLFIIQSKTFTTQETLTLFATALEWVRAGGTPEAEAMQCFVAVTASESLALAQGFSPERCFLFWDWVGGRTSVWAAIGLPLALHIGSNGFRAFLQGAAEMDAHFLNTPSAENLPHLLALLGIWNRNFLQASSHAVVCYDYRLRLFTPFLQQLEMESNGKRVQRDGQPSAVATAPVVWGGLGIDGQHAYFQLLHQGTDAIPVDFIGVQNDDPPFPRASVHRHVVNINLRAQQEALALGRPELQTRDALASQGLQPDDVNRLTPHRSYPGERPSSLISLENGLSAQALGALIALYEHKVFTQAAIWNICAYDQWGVELGKVIAKRWG
ncbi:MAG: glucose-6-phosphate isomerase [Burkholderiaceae bacterium]